MESSTTANMYFYPLNLYSAFRSHGLVVWTVIDGGTVVDVLKANSFLGLESVDIHSLALFLDHLCVLSLNCLYAGH